MSALRESQIDVALSIIKEQHPLTGISLIQAFPSIDVFFYRITSWFRTRTHQPQVDEMIEMKDLPPSSRSAEGMNGSGSDEEQTKGGGKRSLKDKIKQQDFKKKLKLSTLLKKQCKKKSIDGVPGILGHQYISTESVEGPDFQLDKGEDPVKRLGFGIVSYFSMVKTYIVLFSILTVIHIPVMYQYSNYSVIAGTKQDKGFASYSLGNLGQSSTKCQSVRLVGDSILLGCQAGTITEIPDYGVYEGNSEADIKNLCTSKTDIYDTELAECSHLSKDSSKAYEELLSKCLGKKDCLIKDFNQVLTLGKQIDHPKCVLQRTSVFFVQYKCTISEEEKTEKRRIAALASAVSILSSLLLASFIFFSKRSIFIKKELYDLETVTASDYTLQMDLNEDQSDYLSNLPQLHPSERHQELTPGIRLKENLTKIIEDYMHTLRKHSSQGQKLKVADLNFIFKNGHLFRLLKERSKNINKNDRLAEVESELILKKAMHDTPFEDLTRPTKVYITFEHEEGRNLMNRFRKLPLGDGSIAVMSQAGEPSNIQWQNLDSTQSTRVFGYLWTIASVVGLFACSLVFSYFQETIGEKLLSKYENHFNCDEISKMYSLEQWAQTSADQWHDYYGNKNEPSILATRPIFPVMNCFCSEQFEQYGRNLYEMQWHDSQGRLTATCSEWLVDSYNLFGAGKLAGFVISLLNAIIKNTVIKTVKAHKSHSISEETNVIMVIVFFAQLFNTGVIIVLKNANFRDFEVPLLNMMFASGHESDFNQIWYEKVGQAITATMIFTIWFPLLETAFKILISHLERLWDRKFTSDPFMTQQESIQNYVDLYSGPSYEFHSRYSEMLLSIAITFMFGTALPVLFPIALVHFIVTMISQRLLVIYYYKEPPSFDETMTLRCVLLSRWSAIWGLALAFWQLGNRQIFDNVLFPVQTQDEGQLSGHTISQVFSDMEVSQPNFGCFVVFLGLFILMVVVSLIPVEHENLKNNEEDLFNFSQALQPNDKQVLIALERYFNQHYNVKTFTHEQFQRIEKAATGPLDKTIMGVPTYRLFDNLFYCQQLTYYPPTFVDFNTIEERIEVDQSYLYLNFAFLTAAQRERLLKARETNVL